MRPQKIGDDDFSVSSFSNVNIFCFLNYSTIVNQISLGCRHNKTFEDIILVFDSHFSPFLTFFRPNKSIIDEMTRDVRSDLQDGDQGRYGHFFHLPGSAILNVDPRPIYFSFYARAQFVAEVRHLLNVNLANLWIKSLQCGNIKYS